MTVVGPVNWSRADRCITMPSATKCSMSPSAVSAEHFAISAPQLMDVKAA
jgi:hypothetical protein